MIGKARQIQQLWQHFGPEWLAYRLTYATRLRTGMLRRSIPATDWPSQPLGGFLKNPALKEPESYLNYRREQAPSFFFTPSSRSLYQPCFARWDKENTGPLDLSDEIARGTLRYFDHTPVQTGFPPDWHLNPFTKERAPADRHWSEINDFDHGDIKIIWEASRFGFAFTLVRAYWRTTDARYAEMFWQAVEDWRENNPPQQGANWKCGQETSLRLMAWCFALYGLLDSPATTAGRVRMLAQMIAVSACRTEANFSYGLSQRNNHGISEAVGLYTVGRLFPEFYQAPKWKRMGAEALESQARQLIYDDGAFSQHSVNYHRLMLHDYLWAIRLGDLQDSPFSEEVKDRVRRAGEFLYLIQDAETGRLPCYGQNDGALILPLNNCDYQDFRPVIQSINYLSTGARCYDDGAWDEDLLWLFGPDAVSAKVAKPLQSDLNAETGGYYTMRSGSGFAFIRCATFRDRPSQADMLHFDLWWRGRNIAIDAGTYSYNAPDPWNNPLAHTAYHNTVSVDSLDQMERVSRFLWMPWLKGRAGYAEKSIGGRLAYWEGGHNGYQRLKTPVNYRRGVLRLGDEWWLVLDDLTSGAEHLYRLHWLLADAPCEWKQDRGRLSLETAAGDYGIEIGTFSGSADSSLVRADEESPRGWRAPYYNYREPALSLDLIQKAASIRFWTLFGPGSAHVIMDEASFRIEAEEWQARVQLQTDDRGPLINSVMLSSVISTGAIADELRISGY